mgnify:CR=1 FL=1
MSDRYVTVQFGPRYSGCATVGYRLRDSSGVPVGDRVTTGIDEIPAQSGSFGALVLLPDSFIGSIVWDTGGEGPAFAIEEINPNAAIPPLDGAIASGGRGAVEWSYQLLNQHARPIAQADIHVSTDPTGRDVVALARTDATGVARFRLSPGEVFLWRSRSGCVFQNPDPRTIEAEA